MDHLPDVHFRNVILLSAITENRCCGLFRNGVFKLISLQRKTLLIQNFFLGSCTLKSCCFLSLSEILSETLRPVPKSPFPDWWFPSLQTTVLLLPLPWLDRNWQEKEWMQPLPSGCVQSTLLSPAGVRVVFYDAETYQRGQQSITLGQVMCLL